jgi:hypothetical protein
MWSQPFIRSYASALEPHRPTIARVVRGLVPLQPDRLELLATLDYLYRQFKGSGGSGPWKDRVMERFLQVKRDTFARQEVMAAYDSMVRADLVEA